MLADVVAIECEFHLANSQWRFDFIVHGPLPLLALLLLGVRGVRGVRGVLGADRPVPPILFEFDDSYRPALLEFG